MVQIAWQIHDIKGELIEVKNYIVKPEGYTIPYNSEKIHGISTKRALEIGLPLGEVLLFFKDALEKAKYIVGHNISFDNRKAESDDSAFFMLKYSLFYEFISALLINYRIK